MRKPRKVESGVQYCATPFTKKRGGLKQEQRAGGGKGGNITLGRDGGQRRRKPKDNPCTPNLSLHILKPFVEKFVGGGGKRVRWGEEGNSKTLGKPDAVSTSYTVFRTKQPSHGIC